jgi:hypothetical protein
MGWVLLALLVFLGVVAGFRGWGNSGAGRRDPAGLRTVASFQAVAFAQREEAKDESPQFWGEPLLREMLERMRPPFEVVRDYSSSYGHEAILGANGRRFTVSVGFVADDEGWLLFVQGERELSPVPDAEESRELLRQLQVALRAIEGVTEIRWTDRASFDRVAPVWESAPFD